MDILIAIGLSVVNLLLLGLVLVGLPGVWAMLILTGLVAWWRWDEGMFSLWVLGLALALALLAELLEFVAGVAGTKKFGGTGWGMAGALGGGLLGGLAGTLLIPIPLAGTLIGAVVGAGLGAAAGEASRGKDRDFCVRSAVGAGVGRFVGTIIKLGLGGLVWLILTIAALWA
jgi:uncharacterized protein YqgC (DUF456 family)